MIDFVLPIRALTRIQSMRKRVILKMVTATLFIAFLVMSNLSIPSLTVFSAFSKKNPKASTYSTLSIRPNDDGNYIGWNPFPVTSPRWQCLDESTQNGDVDFVFTVLDGKRNFCDLQDHTSEKGEISNVKVVIYGRRADVLAGDLTIGIIVCGNYLYEGATVSLSETYAQYESDWATNPETGTSWTWSDIDTLQAGFKSVQVDGLTIWRVTQLFVEITYESQDDDAEYEVLVEWVNDYPWPTPDPDHCDESARGLKNKLASKGWDTEEHGNSGARETHFDDDQQSYVDDVDLAFFSGHGSQGFDSNFVKFLHSAYFSDPWYDRHLLPGDVYQEWGNKDMEWVAFHSCEVLKDDHGAYWASAMDGVHLILGFKTQAKDTDLGSWWADGMVSDGCYDKAMPVAHAWCWAARQTQSGYGLWTRVLGETDEAFEDYLWGEGYVSQDPPVDDTYWYCDQPITEDDESSAQTESPFPDHMNLYVVAPITVDIPYVESIGSIFGLTGGVGYYGDGIYYMTDGTKYLQVSNTGDILYGDSSKLWVIHDAAPELPTKAQAESIAQSFVSDNGLLPIDALLYDTYSSEQGHVNKLDGTVIDSFIIDRQVEYTRSIGGYSVVGPGAKLEVFIGEDSQIIGFFRVFRPVVYADTIDIISEEQAVNILNTYGTKVMLGGAPLGPWDEMNIVSTTLGYYEAGFKEPQTYLIPCYIFVIDFMLEGNVSFTQDVYIAARSSAGVGGFVVPVDKLGLLAPYIGLASAIVVAAVATVVYAKRVKRREENP